MSPSDDEVDITPCDEVSCIAGCGTLEVIQLGFGGDRSRGAGCILRLFAILPFGEVVASCAPVPTFGVLGEICERCVSNSCNSGESNSVIIAGEVSDPVGRVLCLWKCS